MPLVAGLLGQRSACLLVTLVVVHSLEVTSAASLSVDEPRFLVGGVAVIDCAKYPLLAIVRCSDGQLGVSVSEVYVAGNESLQVQLEVNKNKPNEVFILPKNTGTIYPEGEYQIKVVCHSQSTVSEAAQILVSILTPNFAAQANQPYFIETPRYVKVSANTPPGTVIATHKAEFQARKGHQPTTQQYVVHKDFLGTPFQLGSSSGELSVSESLQKEGTLSMYNIVIVADQGHNKAWTVTTIVIERFPEYEEFFSSNGSWTSQQINKTILTIVALLVVWAGNILTLSYAIHFI